MPSSACFISSTFCPFWPIGVMVFLYWQSSLQITYSSLLVLKISAQYSTTLLLASWMSSLLLSLLCLLGSLPTRPSSFLVVLLPLRTMLSSPLSLLFLSTSSNFYTLSYYGSFYHIPSILFFSVTFFLFLSIPLLFLLSVLLPLGVMLVSSIAPFMA